ncbi:hypothetical protein YC2023_044563 [Brassica napus]
MKKKKPKNSPAKSRSSLPAKSTLEKSKDVDLPLAFEVVSDAQIGSQADTVAQQSSVAADLPSSEQSSPPSNKTVIVDPTGDPSLAQIADPFAQFESNRVDSTQIVLETETGKATNCNIKTALQTSLPIANADAKINSLSSQTADETLISTTPSSEEDLTGMDGSAVIKAKAALDPTQQEGNTSQTDAVKRVETAEGDINTPSPPVNVVKQPTVTANPSTDNWCDHAKGLGKRRCPSAPKVCSFCSSTAHDSANCPKKPGQEARGRKTRRGKSKEKKKWVATGPAQSDPQKSVNRSSSPSSSPAIAKAGVIQVITAVGSKLGTEKDQEKGESSVKPYYLRSATPRSNSAASRSSNSNVQPDSSDVESSESELEEGEFSILEPDFELTKIYISTVYASNDAEDRLTLWSEITSMASSYGLDNKPWLVIGDFNQIRVPSEHSLPPTLNMDKRMRDFNDCLMEANLEDLNFRGPTFTWWNKRKLAPVAKKLDRGLVNEDWLIVFPSSVLFFGNPNFSDHAVMAITLEPERTRIKKPFRFYNFMLQNPDFLAVVCIIGYHPRTQQLKISHLMFADDVMVFFDGTSNSLHGIAECLDDFASWSGLHMNTLKTELFTSGLEQRESDAIACYGFPSGNFPIRYLGLPLMSLSVNDSWAWKKLLDLRPLAINFCKVKLGNGKTASFWYDLGNPTTPTRTKPTLPTTLQSTNSGLPTMFRAHHNLLLARTQQRLVALILSTNPTKTRTHRNTKTLRATPTFLLEETVVEVAVGAALTTLFQQCMSNLYPTQTMAREKYGMYGSSTITPCNTQNCRDTNRTQRLEYYNDNSNPGKLHSTQAATETLPNKRQNGI